MIIEKRIKCVHCNSIIIETGNCTCGKVKVIKGIITEGKLGEDFIDVSATLLNE
jgi:hypothetical protein